MSYTHLIVAHDYPPIISARAIRWSALAEHWANQGYGVDVISAWQAGFPMEETLHGVQVHRVNAMWLENLRAWFKSVRAASISQSDRESNEASPAHTRSRIAQIAYWAYHRVYKHLYWPDGAFPWYRPACRQSKVLLSSKQVDSFITVSPYFTAHLVGLRIHKAFPRMRWLVDIGDPFSFEEVEPHNNPHLYRRLNFLTEQRVFRHADAISVTTDETREKYAQLFPGDAHKIHVIPPLLSTQRDHEKHTPIFPKDDKLRLVYIGRLYADGRRPDFLLKLFKTLLKTSIGDQIELHFFGDARAVENSFAAHKSLLDDNIFLHGQVDHKMATRALHEASVLINIGNKSSYQLPSKVVEYVSTGKPILNISQVEHDSSMNFLQSYPAVLNLRDIGNLNIEESSEALLRFLISLPEPLKPVEIDQLLSSFHIEAISAKYEAII